MCIRHARVLLGVSPARPFQMGLGLTEAYLKQSCGQGLSPHCQGLEVRGLWQGEVVSK